VHEGPIFHDATQRRWRFIKASALGGSLLVTVMLLVFISSLRTTLDLPGIPGITAAEVRASLRRLIPRRQTRIAQFLAGRARGRLLDAVAKDRRVRARKAAVPPIKSPQIVAAFYAPWQETGLYSLRYNAQAMTHVLPSWVHLRADGQGLDLRDWDPDTVPHNRDVLNIAHTNNLNVVPVFSNAQISLTGAGEFDPVRAHTMLTSSVFSNRVIIDLRRWCLENHFQGINVDFENLRPEDYALMPSFLERMKQSFAPAGLVVSADLEAKRPDLWRSVAAICDFVVVMAYDEHSETSAPGPIASIGWYRKVLDDAAKVIPREKLVVGLANYAYDWQAGREWAEPTTYQGALLQAQKAANGEKPEDIIDFDETALNPTYNYRDDEGKDHEVWFLDAITAANQWALAQSYGIRGCAVWVLGSNDPSIWTFIDRRRLNRPPPWHQLETIEFPYYVEFSGDGEIAHVQRTPTKGSRSMEIDRGTDLAIDEDYHMFPTSFVISRSGYKEKMLSLTIDDGPASPYTAQMLDELKRYDVKATFFLIGQNAERYPGLVRRIWAEGHEVGNHTFTHPNIGAMTIERAKLELNATQRVFQSLLHRSTLLFRPPYNADAEPTSAEEVEPIRLASALNYITVLEFIDPQDWNTVERDAQGNLRGRTAEEMLQTVKMQLRTEKGSCILLHDGGGDRRETVRLIPMLITELRKEGYTFVPVSTLIDSTRDRINPPVGAADTLLLANDRIVFETFYLSELFLGIAFITAIILGAARVIFVTALALAAKWRENHELFDETYRPSVSVVIAAYNEEKVIAKTIRAVLRNRYETLEVIVVDDGSADDTSGEVTRHFAKHDNVKLLRQENAGKASALNRGIGTATGDIIIALDADTVFTKDTISLLVRHFADPIVGAVAGNVKVGNRVNALTYWQSIEYVTSQNLDRRAYATINSVTVVPGAVGAWRREAILQAGGYTGDTMAEDMDLTWRIRRIGWRIDTESAAIGYTEAPDSFGALFRQRFRWAFGTLQCLWKHRRAMGRYGYFGRVMLPALWLFQVFFQVLSPLVDVQILWGIGNVAHAYTRAHLRGDWQPLPNALASLYLIVFMYLFFFAIELVGSLVAYILDRENPKVLVWLFWQRFVYRQLMYAVLLRSVKTALSGMRTGWGKLERKGTVGVDAGDLQPEARL